MKKVEQVTQLQLMMFTTVYLFSTTIGFLINPIIEIGSYSSWVSFICGAIIALVFLYIASYVCEKIPNNSLLENGDKIVSKWVHNFFLFYIGFYFFHYSALVSRLFQDFLVQTYLPTTPDRVIAICLSLLAVVATWSGLEPIFRFVQLFFFFTIAAAVSIPILIATDLEYDILIAFFNHIQMAPIAKTTMFTVPWFTDLILILLFYHWIRDSKKTIKSISIGIGVNIILVLPNLLVTIILFRPYYASDLTYPVLEVIRQISIGNFIENLDPILVSIWFVGIVVKISITLYGAILVLAKLLKVQNYRLLVPPMGLFMFGYSMQLDGSATEINYFITEAWSGFGWSVAFIPLIYFIVLKIRGLVSNKPKHSTKYRKN
ncbi:spore germination protein KB [Natronobacillus azotifigens]|uniref:Endospore germination permease n=1 Tax=Natronobacillus azotifigens TaxID=472978 RepID=A0A9J6R7T9_9BACI|nr:endospore germination permease [Natronobacillus azotifigens]MCZ0701706.1 endospore germination permease [Natronobacillus azotifigens]